jgi:hypothetical protein
MKLPRASPGTTVVIAADVWNVLAAAVEKSNNFTVSAPLHLSESPSGRALSLELPRHVTFKVSSNVSSQVGRYNAKSFIEGVKGNATGNLVEADIGSLASADDCIVWHVPEIVVGSSKHLLKADGVYTGRVAGTDSSGKKIVLFGTLPVGVTTAPTTLSGSGNSADATTWSRASDGTPVTVQWSRIAWDGTAHILYGFYRTGSYDSCGILTFVSGETRYIIDSAQDCTT